MLICSCGQRLKVVKTLNQYNGKIQYLKCSCGKKYKNRVINSLMEY